MKILLTGASGFIGGHVNSALEATGFRVVPASRCNGFDFNRLTRPAYWLPHLQDIDAVINCVGIITESRSSRFEVLHREAPSALFRACVEAGVGRVIQVSALGADERAGTGYLLSKRIADDQLRQLPLDWFVLRPSLVYGRGGRSMAMFRRLAALPVLPLPEGGRQMIQPVHIDDLVQTVLACLTRGTGGITLDVVGAKSVSLIDWLQMMRRKAGKAPAVVLPVAFGPSLALAQLARHLVPLFHPDNLHMLREGSVADAAQLATVLGRMPLAVEEGWERL